NAPVDRGPTPDRLAASSVHRRVSARSGERAKPCPCRLHQEGRSPHKGRYAYLGRRAFVGDSMRLLSAARRCAFTTGDPFPAAASSAALLRLPTRADTTDTRGARATDCSGRSSPAWRVPFPPNTRDIGG